MTLILVTLFSDLDPSVGYASLEYDSCVQSSSTSPELGAKKKAPRKLRSAYSFLDGKREGRPFLKKRSPLALLCRIIILDSDQYNLLISRMRSRLFSLQS